MASNDANTPYGFEYKSQAEIFGFPVVHISFKYHRRLHPFWKRGMLPVPARGVIAIGQVAFGVVTISQFGAGLVVLSQFAIGAFVIAQFTIALSAIAQFGVCLYRGYGQFMLNLWDMLSRL